MPKNQIITGLDIGSSAIKILVASKKNNENNFEILFKGEEPSLGVRRGVVIDVDKVSRSIQMLVDRARIETGQKINSVFVNIGGSHIFCALSHGMVAVSRADRNISKEDVNRVLQEAARSIALPSNNEILEIFPKKFIVDGAEGIKTVENLQGGRLETEILVLSSFLPYKNNLIQAVLDAGLQVLDITPSAMASSSVVLSQRQKELGVAVLDIGAGTSELAVFEEGDLIHLAVFPVGSGNITSDIAVGLKVDVDVAEAIKIQKGACVFKGNDKKEKIDIEEEDPLVFSQKALTGIISARVSEIFDEVEKELKKISKHNLLPSGIVLVGGGARLSKIVELAKKELKLSCRAGKISYFPELEEELSYATVCGLVYNSIIPESGRLNEQNIFSSNSIGSKIKKIFRNFLP